jgi:hypothetical protein
VSATVSDRFSAIRAALPAEGLFAEKEWLFSPEPFPLNAAMVEGLHRLGHRLQLFNRASNQLYQLSVRGRQPDWIVGYLDRGKPAELVELGREKILRDQLPAVIRPDLIITAEGLAMAEVDNVPGGIGLTAWLNKTYSAFDPAIIGGADGMIEGFRSILPAGDIVISEEAATYKPEMEWLSRAINHAGAHVHVHAANGYEPQGRDVYRFFELFDLPKIKGSSALLKAVARGELRMTPPPKAYLEEKMWFALFWLRPLREFWRRELRENHWRKLQQIIPYTWLLDPEPLPRHAVIPRLEIHDWMELAHFSQKERELILKMSGFSELAWGSRSVVLAQDLPQKEWQARLQGALDDFQHHPYVLQRFHRGTLVEHPFFDPASGSIQMMRGRVRLCPYYFVIDGKAELRGVLATVCPADKKLLHGMKDAIMVPCTVRG